VCDYWGKSEEEEEEEEEKLSVQRLRRKMIANLREKGLRFCCWQSQKSYRRRRLVKGMGRAIAFSFRFRLGSLEEKGLSAISLYFHAQPLFSESSPSPSSSSSVAE